MRCSLSLEFERFDEHIFAKRSPVCNPLRIIFASKLCQDDKDQSDSQRVRNPLWLAAISKAVKVIKEAIDIKMKG